MRQKGFTLVELMVVVLIVAILAAVAIPLMTGRVDAAKWSEGKAGAGSIHSAARSFCAEKGSDWTGTWGNVSLWATDATENLGFAEGDLDGTYFSDACYGVTFSDYNQYAITVTAASAEGDREAPTSPATMTLTVGTDGIPTWSD